MAQFGMTITNIGLAKMTNAQITQKTVDAKYMVLGDGNGAYYTPNQSQTSLKKEVWRGLLADISVSESNPNKLTFSAYLPSTVGGFTIREVGIVDTDNQLIALSLFPEQYKPQMSEGITDDSLIHCVIETSNASVVTLAVDPTIIIASRKYVDEKIAKIGGAADKVQEQLTQHLDDYTGHVPYLIDSGTANAKVVELQSNPTNYVEGMAISFKNKIQNTGAVTININGLGTKPIVKANGNPLTSGNLKVNSVYTLRYNGTSFILQGEGGEYGTATSADVLSGKTIGTENGIVTGTATITSLGGFLGTTGNIGIPYSQTVRITLPFKPSMLSIYNPQYVIDNENNARLAVYLHTSRGTGAFVSHSGALLITKINDYNYDVYNGSNSWGAGNYNFEWTARQ